MAPLRGLGTHNVHGGSKKKFVVATPGCEYLTVATDSQTAYHNKLPLGCISHEALNVLQHVCKPSELHILSGSLDMTLSIEMRQQALLPVFIKTGLLSKEAKTRRPQVSPKYLPTSQIHGNPCLICWKICASFICRHCHIVAQYILFASDVLEMLHNKN